MQLDFLSVCVILLVVKYISTGHRSDVDERLRSQSTGVSNDENRADGETSAPSDISVVTRAEVSLQKFTAFMDENDVCGVNVTSCQNACGDFRAMPCSCDNVCQVYENCCEDYFDVCSKQKTISSFVVSVVNTTVTCPSYVNFLLLSGCPADENTNASRRCLQSSPISIEDIVPVTPRQSSLYFKNRYCAECNGFRYVEYWSGTVFGMYGFRGMGIFFQDISNKKVTIDWDSQPKNHLRPCVPSAHQSYEMTLNNTDALSVLCNAFTSYVYSSSADKFFRNRYCIEGIGNNSTNISCEPVTNITTNSDVNSSFTFRKGPERNEWLIYGMSDRTDHIEVVTCYSNGTDACKITTCVDGYTLQRGSCQKRRMKLIIKTTFNPIDFGTEDAPFDLMESFVSKLSLSVIHRMHALGAKGSRCYLDTQAKSLIYSSDVLWKLKQEFLCSFKVDIIDKRKLFHTDLSIKLSTAMTAPMSQAGLNIEAKITACVADEDSVSTRYDFCFESATNTSRSLVRLPQSSYAESVISDICCSMSVLGLFTRIILQPVIPFYKSAPGKIQFCLCLTLFMAYIVFLTGALVQEGSVVCTVLAVLTHWGFLSALLWMNIIAFKMWQTFRSWRSQLNSQTTVTLSLSALFAMFPPLLTIIVGLLMDHFIPDSPFSPNYGANVCWITKTSSMIVFFVIPSNMITIINSVLVYLALLGIWKERKAFREVASLNNRVDLELAVKVIVLVGVTWLIGLIGIVLRYDFAWMMFTIVNGSLGFLISFVLLFNKRVYRVLKKPVCRWIRRFTHQRAADMSSVSASTMSTYRITAQS